MIALWKLSLEFDLAINSKTAEVGKSHTIQAGSWGHSLCLQPHCDKIASCFREPG